MIYFTLVSTTATSLLLNMTPEGGVVKDPPDVLVSLLPTFSVTLRSAVILQEHTLNTFRLTGCTLWLDECREKQPTWKAWCRFIVEPHFGILQHITVYYIMLWHWFRFTNEVDYSLFRHYSKCFFSMSIRECLWAQSIGISKQNFYEYEKTSLRNLSRIRPLPEHGGDPGEGRFPGTSLL